MSGSIILRKSEEGGSDAVCFDVVAYGEKLCAVRVDVDYHSRIMTTEIHDYMEVTDVRDE